MAVAFGREGSILRQWKEYSALVYEAFKNTPSVDEMRDRVASANINQESLLATDYLNHFNEVAMIMEMLPDMPDFVEDVKAWEAKSYKQHFLDSTFSDKELAVAAYDCVPTPYLIAFEGATVRASALVRKSIPELESVIETAERDRIEIVTKDICLKIEALMSAMRSIINGELETLQQDDIDDMLSSGDTQSASPPDESDVYDGAVTAGDDPVALDQDSIDSLFD